MAFGIAEIIVLGLLAEWILRRLGVPGLIGMLLVGVALGPQMLDFLDPNLMAAGPDLRLIALIVILLRAGFGLSKRTLSRVGGRSLLLSFIPATCEGMMITLAGTWLLGFTLLEAALLGSVLAAVSPAVVVPMMLRFNEEGRGTAKDIPAMVMAAASVDDVYVIVVHGALLGLYLGGGVNIAWELASVPLSLLLGGSAGLLAGFAMYKCFDRFNPRATKRVLTVVAAAILLVRLQGVLAWAGVPFASLVAAMAIGFIILERREETAHEIAAKLAKIWVFAEIVLFSMVGAQVDVGVIWEAGAAGLALIALGLVARGGGVIICLLGSNLQIGERLFVLLAYSPKATVQAAIGAAPLMAMRAAGMDTRPGEVILAVAVLSIVTTAPLGAWAMANVGRKVLTLDNPPPP